MSSAKTRRLSTKGKLLTIAAMFAIGTAAFAVFLPYVFVTYGNNAS